MANEKQLDILRQGVRAWNTWRREVDEDIDLSGANLVCANLSHANLNDANLSHANLNEANLTSTNLNYANLTSANFSNANLTCANLINANLTSANLSNVKLRTANLNDANLYSANLSRSDLTNAELFCTTFTNIDLSTVIGLGTARHFGPSTIGIDTLYLSKGEIPEEFLRGCGVPESLIMQARALIRAKDGIDFYSCFISYSTRDEEFAQRLHGRLRQDQVRVWYSPHDIQSGRHLHEQIEEAIRVYDKLLILLSPDSMDSSWVHTELRKARKLERRTSKRKLFPLRLVDYEQVADWECPDGDSGEDLAVEVRKYFIPDFTRWKDHDEFEKSYARLLKDLRGST